MLLKIIILFALVATGGRAQGADCSEQRLESFLALTKALEGPQRSFPTYLPDLSGSNQAKDSWVRTQDALSELLSWPKITLVVKSSDELRFLPYVMARSHVLLATDDAQVLNEARGDKVIAVAQSYQLRLSVLWLGDGDHGLLRKIAGQTGGEFINRDDLLARKICPLPTP